MTLESPTTYAEWYWKQGLEQRKAFDESIEKAFSPVYSRIFSDIPELAEMPAGIIDLVHLLVEPPTPGIGGFVLGAGQSTVGEMLHNALAPFMSKFKRSINRRGKETWITGEQAITLMQRRKLTEEYFYDILASEGYERIIADFLYESMYPYPTLPDLITYGRYHGNPDDPIDVVGKFYDVPELDYPLWEWLSLQKLNTEQVLSLFKRDKYSTSEADTELARIGWDRTDRPSVIDLAYSLPNAMLLVQGDLFQGKEQRSILEDISKADIHPDYASLYLDGVLTKPSSQDVIAYQLRQDPDLSYLSPELSKIGIHPYYHTLYKELAKPIPPVADIITMAVREAFTPEIAARFGQYEGLPAAYVEWVGKKGLTKEWAERYWAAHWSLPSPQQGFEMLHRGVINESDLSLLLRALDIMPFWRDKLIEISFNPLTRVDVRRMYGLGVLDKAGVLKAYKDIGYNETNANLMTEFTVRYQDAIKQREEERAEAAKEKRVVPWTNAQTLKFLKMGLITEDRARDELVALGYDEEHISVYFASLKPAP